MSARQVILKRLIESRNTAVERAIEVALLEAPAEEQRELAQVLLERNRRAGWVTLIRAFHRLDESIREQLLTRPRDLFGPLAETLQDAQGPARENVITIVHRCADVRLVYLLAESLMDPRPEVRSLAGDFLLEAVRRHWRLTRAPGPDEPLPASDPDDAVQLRRAVEVALRHFKTHRQSSALLAALIHERQLESGMTGGGPGATGGSLWTLFQDPYDDRTRAATIMLRAPGEPALATSMFLALGSSLKPAAMAGLASVESPAIAAALARESYRLIDPALREPAQGVNHLKLLPALRKDPPWNLSNWPCWVRLIELVGLQPSERLNWLSRMLESIPASSEACAWKIFVCRGIAETALPDAAIPLAALVRDAHERVARFAARVLLTRRHPDWRERALGVLSTSPHASVRRMATLVQGGREPENVPAPSGRWNTAPGAGVTRSDRATSVAARGFEQTWNSYQRMPPAVQHTTARNVAADPALADQLRVKFQGSPQEVAQALRMIATLPNLTPYRAHIIALCGHSDPRIAAMAVRLVGKLEDARLKELLEAAAQHTDPRVRANAVESMEELHIADHSQQVLAMLNSRHNRERANAIKALGQFNFGTARECLARMLTDTNPLHRMSALWVVGELNLLEIMRQVSGIARRDPNLRVRRKAAEMLEALSGNLAGHT